MELARRALAKAESSDCRLLLPIDLVLGDRFDAEAERREQDGVEVPDGWMGLDIGPRTAAAYARRDRAARAPCSGTGRWAPSRWSRSRAARAPWPRRWRRRPARPWSAAATPRAALAQFGLDEDVDHLRPAAAPRSSCSRASRCRAWRCSMTPDATPADRRQLEDVGHPRAGRRLLRAPARRCCPTSGAGRGVGICAPFTSLDVCVEKLSGSGVAVYAQNMHQEDSRRLHRRGVGGDAHRDRRGRRGAGPFRAAPVLRRDRPRASGEGGRRAGGRAAADPLRRARPRTSARPARPSASFAIRCRRGSRRSSPSAWPR